MEKILFGIHPVLEALKAQPSQVLQIFLPQGALPEKKRNIYSLAQQHKIKVHFVPRTRLDVLSNKENHQGVVAIISAYGYQPLESLLKKWKTSGRKALFVILDGIEDPRNFGAIVRTANTAGAHGIIVPKHRSAPLNEVVAKTAAGALAHTPVCRVQNLTSVITILKKEGVWIVGTADDAEQNLYSLDCKLNLAVVVGSEGKGIRSLVKKGCDFLVSIPMQGEIGSLNASVAASVALYEIIRQRHYA